jgi:hypothetical protein
MREHELSGNILCDYEWAGYVIFHTAPASPVFIDGRYEMIYPARIARDLCRFLRRARRCAQRNRFVFV